MSPIFGLTLKKPTESFPLRFCKDPFKPKPMLNVQPSVVNLSFYRFLDLTSEWLQSWKPRIQSECDRLELRGTILLAPEGINGFLAGSRDRIDLLMAWLRATPEVPELRTLEAKESFSDTQPFRKMKVKLKKEIIPMGVSDLNPAKNRAPALTPEELKQWLDEGHDVVLLDTRNDYELSSGTFEGALELQIKTFRKFGEEVQRLLPEFRDRPIVTYCTGGIRCEKAAPLMQKLGFKNVYQLEGGILKYLEKCGSAHYRGKCFVFDEREAIGPQEITRKGV